MGLNSKLKKKEELCVWTQQKTILKRSSLTLEEK